MRLRVAMTVEGTLLFGIDNPGVIQRQWDRIVAAALEETALSWWANCAPQHFQPGSRGRYPGSFFVRKRSTQARKVRRFGHSLPLVTYAAGRPPTRRLTNERALQDAPGGRVTNRTGEVRASWSAPPVGEVYKDEAVAMNRRDMAHVTRVLYRAIGRGLKGTKARARTSVGRRYAGARRRRVRRRIV